MIKWWEQNSNLVFLNVSSMHIHDIRIYRLTDDFPEVSFSFQSQDYLDRDGLESTPVQVLSQVLPLFSYLTPRKSFCRSLIFHVWRGWVKVRKGQNCKRFCRPSSPTSHQLLEALLHGANITYTQTLLKTKSSPLSGKHLSPLDSTTGKCFLIMC